MCVSHASSIHSHDVFWIKNLSNYCHNIFECVIGIIITVISCKMSMVEIF